MKEVFSFQQSAFRKAFLVCVLCSVFCTPLFAQEAFYIYRNDGNFHGFFYDEVVQMNYSKIGLDSVEYEQYVTYEVELADTTYRIPLASIDSIGFQQPEIKFNPRVKFIEKDGYSPYVDLSTFVIGWGVEKQTYYFRNLPDNMVPQAGDVLIGLSSDTHADLYSDGGSFSCIVESVTVSDDEDDNGPFKMCYVEGRYVENLDEVFTQFVMVEQIGYDKEGNQIMHRASAHMPEGFPQPKRVRKAEDASDVTLIDFESTITRQWLPGGSEGSTSIELSAGVGMQVKFRVAYNISWTRMMVTISNDVITKIKPAIAMSVSKSDEYRMGDIITYPRNIKLPVQCPIFELDPSPDIFLRWEGKMEAKLNLPQVRLGVGVHYGIDTDNLFPVTCGLHLVPDDAPEPSDDMLDVSGEVTLSGYIQAGLKFGATLSTNSWIKKIFYGQIGLYLYAGPKLGGQVSISEDLLNIGGGSLYNAYTKSLVYATALSLDLEAKATAQAFWKDPVEKKFFDKNWSFGSDTIRLAPKFDSVKIAFTDQDVVFTVPSKQERILSYSKLGLKIYYSSWFDSLIATIPDIDYDHKIKNYTFSYPLKDLKAGITYKVKSAITYAGHGPYEGYLAGGDRFRIPYTMKMEADEMRFGMAGGEQSITFTTNCVPSGINWNLGTATTIEMLKYKAKLDTIDLDAGRFKLTCTANKNKTLFGNRTFSADDRRGPYISLGGDTTQYHFGVSQDDNDLSDVDVDVSVLFNTESDQHFTTVEPDDIVATRSGKNAITITGEGLELHIKRVSDASAYQDTISVSGTMQKVRTTTDSKGGVTTETITAELQDVLLTASWTGSYSKVISGNVPSATYDYERTDAEGQVIESKHETNQGDVTLRWFTIRVN